MTIFLSTARFIAAGLGSGWVPAAPGTSGSLAALVAAWFVIHAWGTLSLWFGWFFLLPVACWSTYIALAGEQESDPAWVVPMTFWPAYLQDWCCWREISW